jgi:ABC-type nitrate/sulfonate/bicarbonate transport system substrate-binding protein
MMRKIFFALLAIFLLHTSLQAADKIRVAMPADAGHFTLPLAQKRGFLQEEGFDAELVTINGPIANIALASGEIDYYTAFGSSMRAMIQGKLPTRIVACYRPLPHFVIVARPEIKSIKDLKGKIFGNSPGNGVDLVARLMLRHFGMDPDRDIKYTAGTNDTALARMKQGLMDATALPVPRDYQAIKLGFNVLARAEDLFTYPISGVVANTKKIKERPDEIRRLIKAGIKANRYMRANRDGTIEVLMSTYRLDKEPATALYNSFVKGFNDDGSLPEDGLRRLIEDTKTVTKVDREIVQSDVADLSILRQVQREMGIK